MALRIVDFEIDEHNEREMAAHGVTPSEVFQVLLSGSWRLRKNHGAQAVQRPYIMIGLTDGGRLLYIPIQLIDEELGVWRPVTAFTP